MTPSSFIYLRKCLPLLCERQNCWAGVFRFFVLFCFFYASAYFNPLSGLQCFSSKRITWSYGSFFVHNKSFFHSYFHSSLFVFNIRLSGFDVFWCGLPSSAVGWNTCGLQIHISLFHFYAIH